MRKKIVCSSNKYLLRIDEIFNLDDDEQYIDGDSVVILLGEKDKEIADTLLSGRKILENAKENNIKFVDVEIAYNSFPTFAAFFINLIKPLKRKNYIIGTTTYWTFLSGIEDKNLTRGVRNAKNAYQWAKGKPWSFSEVERRKRYTTLYNSLKEKGYDYNNPMLVMINRRFGIRDQLLQGHHRITLCKELGIDEVAIKFWATHKSPDFMKYVDKIVSKFKRKK